MSAANLRLVSPALVAEYLRSGPVNRALKDLARLADVQLAIEGPSQVDHKTDQTKDAARQMAIQYRGSPAGRLILHPSGPEPAVTETAQAMTSLVEHMLDRETAVGDLAEALMTGYEELNLLYNLLPTIATKVDTAELGEVLVAEAAQTLGCRRVSLLVLDQKRERYTVLAARGVPEEVKGTTIPVAETVAAQSLYDDDLLVVNDMSERPDLAKRSRGRYDSDSFAVVRVPLKAHGEALGFLTATERIEGPEFTARDHKLLEGLSAMGASALLNCRLHAAVNQQMISTIHALASAVDAKDQYTHDHAGRVAQLCVATARELGITDGPTCREVELSGLLHDIGKIGIPDVILSKPAKLTPQEFTQVQCHVHIGARIVGYVAGLEGVAKAILHHHERYDGLGYPSGLSGQAIPLPSALIAVADTFDTLTSDRPYHKACSIDDALREMRRCKGTQLDPRVVEACIAVINRERTLGHRPGQQGESLITLQPAFTIT
ncbi:MAG: HD-GYP domain-containing protein [Planctomycetota bacterium]|jgi:HD-GYP domain-containing protein (c-di-GMP phosphodiesterase class II)